MMEFRGNHAQKPNQMKNVPTGSAGTKPSASNSKYGPRAVIQAINNSTNEGWISLVKLGKLYSDAAFVLV